jgi:hypothetical protein
MIKPKLMEPEIRSEFSRRSKRRTLRFLSLMPAAFLEAFVVRLLTDMGVGKGPLIALLIAMTLIPWSVLDFRDWRCPACDCFLGKYGVVRAGVQGVGTTTLFRSDDEPDPDASICKRCGVRLL